FKVFIINVAANTNRIKIMKPVFATGSTSTVGKNLSFAVPNYNIRNDLMISRIVLNVAATKESSIFIRDFCFSEAVNAGIGNTKYQFVFFFQCSLLLCYFFVA